MLKNIGGGGLHMSTPGYTSNDFGDLIKDNGIIDDDGELYLDISVGDRVKVIVSWDDWLVDRVNFDDWWAERAGRPNPWGDKVINNDGEYDPHGQDYRTMMFGYGETEVKILAKSDRDQATGYNYPDPRKPFEPVEIVEHELTFDSRVELYVGARELRFVTEGEAHNLHVFSTVDLHKDQQVPESSILIPGESKGSFTVGATNVTDNSVELFSSQGPTDDGRIKPDVMAPNRVTTTSLNPFVGTAASASHVAGMAILIKEKFPGASTDQIQTMMEKTTHDYHWKTNTRGTGIINLEMFENDILAFGINNRDCDPCFYPQTTYAELGDTITWVNAGTTPITITVNNKDNTIDRGETFSVPFENYGNFEYSDSRYPWATGTISIVTDMPPIISILNDIAMNHDDDKAIRVSATDPDGDLITYSLTAPNFVTLSDNIITISPNSDDIGEHTITVSATASGQSDTESFVISVNEPPKTMISGTIFNDINSNGRQDPGESGIQGYEMIAINAVTNDTSRVNTAKDGTYSFEVVPDQTYLVQTGYFPPNTIVVDPNKSWFTYVALDKSEHVTFDVGFHNVTEPEWVELEIRAYLDTNANLKRDPGEPPVSGLGNDNVTFYIYTYTIGPVAYLGTWAEITDSNGIATINNLVPADFAILADANNLAEHGYAWVSTEWISPPRDDGAPLVDDPEPGSKHIVEIGLILSQ